MKALLKLIVSSNTFIDVFKSYKFNIKIYKNEQSEKKQDKT